MRRFEFIEGSSSKFWEAAVEGSSFVVVYGRIGTPGQRKEKAFPSVDLATREHDRKVAEKIREGYRETAASSGANASAPAPLRPLPPRVKARKPSAAAVASAADALMALESEVGSRSWKVSLKARRALRALEEVAGCDPANHGALTAVFDGLLETVSASRGSRRLPLRLALSMLALLDVGAFSRALAVWRAVDDGSPAAPALRALAALSDAIDDDELSLRACALLGERPDAGGPAEAVWQKRWNALRPHLDARLTARSSTRSAVLAALDVTGDAHLARRIARMAA